MEIRLYKTETGKFGYSIWEKDFDLGSGQGFSSLRSIRKLLTTYNMDNTVKEDLFKKAAKITLTNWAHKNKTHHILKTA